MIGIIIIGAVLFIIVVAIAIASLRDTAGQTHARQLDQRVRSAERQIHDIGQRTRAAIIQEAERRQQQR